MGSREKNVKVFKHTGKSQRSDVLLSLPIANAIKKRVLSGKTLYPKRGYFNIYFLEGGIEKTAKIKVGTITTWVTRRNVIPELGVTLRDFLNEARRQYRIDKNEQRVECLIEQAEKALSQIIDTNTRVPFRDVNGNIVIDTGSGKVVEVEDPSLLKTQMDTAKFVLERLDSIRYAKKKSIKSYSEVFSLSDLRKRKVSQESF